jgi:hypothetical protein
VPVRDCVDALAVAVNVTVPPPLPVAPPVTLSHVLALLAAVHEQPAAAAIVVVPDPPDAATLPLTGEIEYEQPTPLCVTVKVWPAIDSVPVR